MSLKNGPVRGDEKQEKCGRVIPVSHQFSHKGAGGDVGEGGESGGMCGRDPITFRLLVD
ncbi:MAG: hypothetical protein V9G20_13565 [Candidatus Promineifilaceae bacterium]